MATTINVGIGEIIYDVALCGGCGTCTEQCSMGVWTLVTVGRKKQAKPENADMCLVCHVCEKRCPTGAIKIMPPLADI